MACDWPLALASCRGAPLDSHQLVRQRWGFLVLVYLIRSSAQESPLIGHDEVRPYNGVRLRTVVPRGICFTLQQVGKLGWGGLFAPS